MDHLTLPGDLIFRISKSLLLYVIHHSIFPAVLLVTLPLVHLATLSDLLPAVLFYIVLLHILLFMHPFCVTSS